MMGVKRAIRWHTLELDLFGLSDDLCCLYTIPRSQSIISSGLTCNGWFKEIQIFRKELRRTRGWFSLILARLSYEIAVAMSMDGEGPNSGDLPRWFETLVGRWSQPFLSGIRASAATFNAYNPRVGTLLNILKPPIDQFSVSWFTKFDVPVWYRWGRAESMMDHLQYLTPPAEHLQQATTFLTTSPSDNRPSQDPSNVSQIPAKSSSSEKPWIPFLERRQRACDAMAAKETDSQRRRRVDRERNPPFVKTVVFVWEEDDDGSYTRTKVLQKDNEETLLEFGKNQKVYNAFLNEWDCGCTFGDLLDEEKERRQDDDDDDDFAFPIGMAVNRHPPSPVLASAESSASRASANELASKSFGPWVPVFREPESTYVYDVGAYPATQTLYEFYGFTPPLPVPVKHPNPVAISENITKVFRAMVGMSTLDPAFEKSVIFQYCYEFLTSYASSVPRNELFDLSVGNRQPLAGCTRIKSLHPIGTNVFIFIFDKDSSSPPWNLVVTNPIDALFICRLPSDISPPDIARELYNRGVQFHTLLPLPISPTTIIPPLSMPIRTSSYQFTRTDYLAYVQECEALLRNPRIARAALMRGGIVWRLVVSLVSFWDILRGPTASVTLHRQGLSVLYRGMQFCDDDLSLSEIDKLCGVVYCYTGKSILRFLIELVINLSEGRGSQTVRMSWWPPDSMWKKEVVDTYWCEKAESFFKKRIASLENGTAVPLTSEAWRQQIKSVSTHRVVVANARKASTTFIDSQIAGRQ